MDQTMSWHFAILRWDLERDGLGDTGVLSSVALLTRRSRIGCEYHAKLATGDVRGCGVVFGKSYIRQPRDKNHPPTR